MLIPPCKVKFKCYNDITMIVINNSRMHQVSIIEKHLEKLAHGYSQDKSRCHLKARRTPITFLLPRIHVNAEIHLVQLLQIKVAQIAYCIF